MNKLAIVVGILALVAVGHHLFAPQQVSFRGAQLTAEVIKQWQAFKKQYPRKFSDPDYEVYRMKIFADNLQTIMKVNSQNLEYTYGLNNFADLTHDEFKKYYLGLKVDGYVPSGKVHVDNGLTPNAIDWTSKGAVQAVKDQGQCGSCWAFSAVGSMESEAAVHGSGLANLAEQQLVDCSRSYGNYGCNGGLMDYAFQYAIDHGMVNESDYTYTARDGTCKVQSGNFHIKSFTDVQAGSTSALANALAQQPISVAVDAETWQFYSGGVFSNCGSSLDHGVLLVGLDDNGVWRIKNSWGTSWGEQGFIRLAKGNTCGIANMSSYPSV